MAAQSGLASLRGLLSLSNVAQPRIFIGHHSDKQRIHACEVPDQHHHAHRQAVLGPRHDGVQHYMHQRLLGMHSSCSTGVDVASDAESSCPDSGQHHAIRVASMLVILDQVKWRSLISDVVERMSLPSVCKSLPVGRSETQWSAQIPGSDTTSSDHLMQ
jgi:hypothetical protein